MTTAILNLMRDAALAYTIGFIDIMGAGNNLISRNLGNYSLETYTAVAVIYWAIALVISLSAQLLEKRLSVTAVSYTHLLPVDKMSCPSFTEKKSPSTVMTTS